ncbi:hypothetical protein V6N13_000745 [Hibiscus sabdariffa]
MEGGLRRVATHMGEMEEPIAILICGCGVPAHLRTSWSNDNPGRRFFGCKNHGSLVYQPCRFFSWFDPPMPPHAKVVLLGLLKRIRANEVQRNKERICWIFVISLCVLFILY